MKIRIRNLIEKSHLIDLLPFGGIEDIAKKLGKDRGTIRGVLQGKWYNAEVLEECLKIIEADLNHKSEVLNQFKKELKEIQK